MFENKRTLNAGHREPADACSSQEDYLIRSESCKTARLFGAHLNYIEGRGYVEDTPKTMSSKRDIPIMEETMQLLNDQKDFWGFKVDKINRYLFCNEVGEPMSRARVQSEIDRIVSRIQEAGYAFDRITPHVFRHTFATRAIEAGMQPQVLKAILGHSSLAMTMDLYGHVLPDIKAQEMEKLINVF